RDFHVTGVQTCALPILFLNRNDVGFRPDEILGRSILESAAPEHRKLIQRTLAKVFENGSTENYEASDKSQRRWYSTMAGPLFRKIGRAPCREGGWGAVA